MGQANEKARAFVPLTDISDEGIGGELQNLEAFAVLFCSATETEFFPTNRDEISDTAWTFRRLVGDLRGKAKRVEAIYSGKAERAEGATA